MDEPRKTREEKARDRRDAIVEAALLEFTARGFADTRIEDVARRAEVAKGTIYLHFADKQALFEGVVRHVMLPAAAQDAGPVDIPAGVSVRSLLEEAMLDSVGNVQLAQVIRLLVSEGLRFPHLLEFYHQEILDPSMARLKALLAEALRRGELRNPQLAEFPMLVGSPMLLGVVWEGIMGERNGLDTPAMMRAFIDALFKAPESGPD